MKPKSKHRIYKFRSGRGYAYRGFSIRPPSTQHWKIVDADGQETPVKTVAKAQQMIDLWYKMGVVV
jgi:hypothetical protein